MLVKLGFVINLKKSTLVPTQILEFLGFILNTLRMKITLPGNKVEKFKSLGNKLLAKPSCTIREVACLIGLMTSYSTAMRFGRLFTHHLEIQKITALHEAADNFDQLMTPDATSRKDILWWISQQDSEYSLIKIPAPSITLCTDASLDGWGGHIVGGRSTGGRWTTVESGFHINHLELLAIFDALKSFFRQKSDQHIRIHSDNSTAVAYIDHMGGTHSKSMNYLTKCIWLQCIARNSWLSAIHIPGSDNEVADFYSRNFRENTEWSLRKDLFSLICDHFGVPDIDLFASRLNKQIKNYVSWYPDPDALATNAFSFDWRPFFSYGFPPFCLLSKVIAKIRTDSARGIFIVPLWPAQPWFLVMLHLLAAKPIILPQSEDLLFLPSSSKKHPLLPQLKLMACLLSGTASERRAFMTRQPKLSWHSGGHLQDISIYPQSDNGVNFLLLNRYIHAEHL